MTDDMTTVQSPPAAGWWLASDGNWYAPETHPDYRPPPPSVPVEGRARKNRGRRVFILVLVLAVVVGAVVAVILLNRTTPLTLQTFNSSPQLVALQGTSCVRDGANADASGIVHDQTIAPLKVTVLVATGSHAGVTSQQITTLTFDGGAINPSSQPWQVSLPAGSAPDCYVIVKAALDLP
jgi:hypothetical protein